MTATATARPAPTTALRRGGDVVLHRLPRPSTEGPPRPGPAVVERLATMLARWYVEAIAGRRDTRALRDLLTPVVEHRVRGVVMREAARRRMGSPSASPVVSVRRCRVDEVGDRWEATVLLDDGDHVSAVATTLHHDGQRWLVSELARPEDRLPGLRPPFLA